MKHDPEKYTSHASTTCINHTTDENGNRSRDGRKDNPRSAEYCIRCGGVRSLSIGPHPFGTTYENARGQRVEMLTASCRACGNDWQIFAIEDKTRPGHFKTHRNAPKRKESLGGNPFGKAKA
jgi:hypothetical protein